MVACASPENWEETRLRLEKMLGDRFELVTVPKEVRCTSISINITHIAHNITCFLLGCKQVRRALNLPATAILCGYLMLGSFVLAPSVVKVPDNDWTEQVPVWLTVCMPTGSGKSTLFRHYLGSYKPYGSNVTY